MMYRKIKLLFIVALFFGISGCGFFSGEKEATPRLSIFIGVDISGSFMKGGYFDDSIDFLAHYIYAHLHGLDGLERPAVLFVGSIGGATADEPKTFYPIQTFENKSIEEIAKKLKEIFPKGKENPFTDYNAFFEQIALTVKNKNLVLRPISIVMLSDGIPDVKLDGETFYTSIVVKPLERLSRNVTIRLLYTDAATGQNWLTKVPRKRVKMWTQDAKVMVSWQDTTLYVPDKPFDEQDRLLAWMKDNVDFGVRAQRVGK
ncbi:hypothetical protein JW960_11100 [candidate division KSB1 bacterium]|nr:hypothetical protein [candidate division KSB1 bacterium]